MTDVPEWEPRLRVLEEIAAATKQVLTEIRGELAEIRTELRDLRRDMAMGFDTANQRLERDFRILFGAIIVVAVGLAGLIARTQHWI